MRASLLVLCVLCAGTAQGAVTHVPLKTGLVLKPEQAYTLTVEATEPTEIGWEAVQAKRRTTNCVQATEITAGVKNAIATAPGASRKYTPVAGKILVEYGRLDRAGHHQRVCRLHRICDAEACKYLGESQTTAGSCSRSMSSSRLTTSKDGSYSVIWCGAIRARLQLQGGVVDR